jgi:hypothetical protein
MDLWAGDMTITYERYKQEILDRIQNLQSLMGEEAHKRSQELGIIDATGMTWEEQDAQAQKQITELQQLLDFLETDSNWTP